MGFWYFKPLLRKLAFLNRMTSKILVNCNAVRQHVSEQENVSLANIDVIYNGIDLKKVTDTPACDMRHEFRKIEACDRIVGIVANFNRRVKKVDLFIRALAEVLKQQENVKFFVIGEGNLKDELMALAKELGCEKALIWAGRKENPLPYVKGFTVGVQSSDSEGFSNSILEYMAAGVPVVATEVGGNPELIADAKNGFLVPPGDHIALAEKNSQLLTDEQLASAMGQEGKRLVREKYDWKIKIKEVESYYYNLLNHT